MCVCARACVLCVHARARACVLTGVGWDAGLGFQVGPRADGGLGEYNEMFVP